MDKQRFLEYLAFLVSVASVEGSQKKAAQQWGISTAYLCDVLQGRREPGPTLLKALGIRKDVTYVEERVQQRESL